MNIELNEKLAELTGNIIGDGCLYGRRGRHLIMISGNIKDDKIFYRNMSAFIFSLIGKKPKIKVHQRALRLTIEYKPLYEFFVSNLGMKYEGKKTYEVSVPRKILSDKNLTKACMRGIVDTDGSIFVADKPGSPNYPSIEITTVSSNLAFPLRDFLLAEGYRAKLRWYDPKNNIQVRTYKLAINGWEMLRKWCEEIGFSHPMKNSLAQKILKEKYGGMGVI